MSATHDPGTVHRLNPFSLTLTSVISFCILLFNSQIFAATAGNPLGIRGFQEAFFALLLIWALVSIWTQQVNYGAVKILDLFVLSIVVFPILYSISTANLIYGQPVLFGLIEERRIFAVLIYFPVMTMLRQRWVSIDGMQSMIVAAAVTCALLAIGVNAEIVPTLQQTAASELSLRGQRASVGPGFIAIAVLILMARTKGGGSRMTLFLLLVLIAAMLFVIQSRQLMIAALIATVFVLRGPRAMLLVAGAVFAIYFGVLFVPAVANGLALIVQLFGQITTQEYLTGSWRGLSYGHVVESIRNGEFFGHGALSPIWNEGFARVIGRYFFLADIGIAGTFFRYGLFGLALYLVYFWVQFRIIRRIADAQQRALHTGILIFLIVALPVAAPLEFRGFVSGLLLASSAFAAKGDTWRRKA